MQLSSVASVHRKARSLDYINCDDIATNDSMHLSSIATERYTGFGEVVRYFDYDLLSRCHSFVMALLQSLP